jgi:hypothetical protein
MGLGPLMFAQLFAMFTAEDGPFGYHPGATFWVASCFCGLAVLVAGSISRDAGAGAAGVKVLGGACGGCGGQGGGCGCGPAPQGEEGDEERPAGAAAAAGEAAREAGGDERRSLLLGEEPL